MKSTSLLLSVVKPEAVGETPEETCGISRRRRSPSDSYPNNRFINSKFRPCAHWRLSAAHIVITQASLADACLCSNFQMCFSRFISADIVTSAAQTAGTLMD